MSRIPVTCEVNLIDDPSPRPTPLATQSRDSKSATRMQINILPDLRPESDFSGSVGILTNLHTVCGR